MPRSAQKISNSVMLYILILKGPEQSLKSEWKWKMHSQYSTSCICEAFRGSQKGYILKSIKTLGFSLPLRPPPKNQQLFIWEHSIGFKCFHELYQKENSDCPAYNWECLGVEGEKACGALVFHFARIILMLGTGMLRPVVQPVTFILTCSESRHHWWAYYILRTKISNSIFLTCSFHLFDFIIVQDGF